MLLEKTGIRIELLSPADIAWHKKNGYVEVRSEKSPEPAGDPFEESEGSEKSPEPAVRKRA